MLVTALSSAAAWQAHARAAGDSAPDVAAAIAAQSAPPAPPRPAAFRVEDAATGSSVRIRGLLHLDGVFTPGASRGGASDEFLLKRARLGLDGAAFQTFRYQFQTDFRNNAVEVLDAWVEARASNALRIRVGKTKGPVSLDRLQGASEILFYERSYPAQIAPNRDIGVQVLGDVAAARVSYALGVFDGAADGASVVTNVDDELDVEGRVFLSPFRGQTESVLRGLSVGASFTSGAAHGTTADPGVSSFRTSGGATVFRYATGAVADGTRRRVDVHANYYAGRLGVLGEWIRSRQEVSLGDVSAAVANQAWNANVSFALTDDRPSYTGIAPRTTFSRSEGTAGALELVARVQAAAFDAAAFDANLASRTASVRRALAWTLGLNWYVNPNTRIVANVERTRFDGGAVEGNRPPERVVLTRLQLAF